MDCPTHIVAEFTDIEGLDTTVIDIVLVDGQEPVVPVTLYVVVTEGLAITIVPVVVLKPDDGIHEYVVAPPAVKTAESPLQIVVALLTVAVGEGLTDMVVTVVFLQLFISVPVTV